MREGTTNSGLRQGFGPARTFVATRDSCSNFSAEMNQPGEAILSGRRWMGLGAIGGRRFAVAKEWAEMDGPKALQMGASYYAALLEGPLRAEQTNCVRIGVRRFAVAKEWAEMDSNHRRQSQQIYSLPRLATPESARRA
jgi:hypothetical protein